MEGSAATRYIFLIKIRIALPRRVFPRSSRMSARDTFGNERAAGTREYLRDSHIKQRENAIVFSRAQSNPFENKNDSVHIDYLLIS